MLTTHRGVLAVLAATAIVVGVSASLPAAQSSPLLGTAHADPSFCGVTNSVEPAHGAGLLYIVRNKCNFTIEVRIWFISFQRYGYAGCKKIEPGGFGYFADHTVDRHWSVQHC